MSEQNKPDDKSSQAVPAIAVAALVVSLFAAQEIILKPTRPGMMNTQPASTEDVRARLWQDPFQAVELYQKQFSQTKSAKENDAEQIIITAEELVSDKTFHFKITKEKHTEPPLIAPPEPSCPADHSIEELGCQIKKEVKEKTVHILAVMMPGGPYAEDHEARLRSRYAMIFGLRAAGYSPVDSGHIEFVDFKNHQASKTDNKTFDRFPDFMPYEWFELNENLESINIKQLNKENEENKLELTKDNKKVLILWLNNDTFMLPQFNSLEQLDQLKNEIIRNRKIDESKINFDIIGPYSSGTLKKLYADMERLEKDLQMCLSDNYLKHSHIFAAYVTVDDWRLIGSTKEGLSKKSRDIDQLMWLNDKVIRTLSMQSEVVPTLLCELALRRVTPYPVDPKESFAEKCPAVAGAIPPRQSEQPHHMVLIGELDSFYSQTLSATILEKIAEFGGNQGNPNNEHIHTFNYLRGLDGITTERTASNQSSKNKDSQTNKPADKELKEQLERPVGSSQLDYLLRLAEQIEHVDKTKASEYGIQAIGITGNDPYDKFLILQALRPKFPKTLFFTTDLDARLFQSSEIKSTRNLIIASPFGLKLNEKWQKNTPPFRDNYQTTLYFTTLLALHFPHTETEAETRRQDSVSYLKKFLENLRKNPRLFEIGNNGPVDLSHTALNGIHPELEFDSENKFSEREDILKISALIFAILSLVVLLRYLVPNRFKPHTVGIFISLSLLVIFYHYYSLVDGSGSEPFASGTSTWPANGIRLVAIILAFYFLCRIYQQLKKDKKEIEKEYVEEGYISPNSPGQTAKTIKRFLAKFIIDEWKMDSRKEPISFKTFWSNYLQLGTNSLYIKRTVIMLMLFFVSFYLLIKFDFLRIPEIPMRGNFSFLIHCITLILVGLLYSILIFWIVDITHLCSHLIRLLTKNEVTWPGDLVNINIRKYGLTREAVEPKILLDFIHQYSNAINRFIYYPFFILFLIMLSRAYYFDNWQITPLLLFVFGFTALTALSSAIRLRIAAQAGKERIIKKLENYSLQLQKNRAPHGQDDGSANLKLLIQEIKDFKEGVFQPLSQHPIVLSVLMPLSSIAAVYLFDYFSLSAFQ